MRSRTVREGSVGLLILVGLIVFGGLVLRRRGLSLGNQTYKFIVNFGDVAGMKEGATVRYRGVDVGKITAIQPRTNGVDTTIEINPADLLIPRDSVIEANQSGLVGETTIDITPLKALPADALSLNPLSSECNSNLVICNQDRVQGQIGVSFIELLRSGTRLAQTYSDPQFFNNLNTLTQSASTAATGVGQLTGELSLLSRSVRQELGTFSKAANSVTTAANQTTAQVGAAATTISNTVGSIGNTVGSIGNTVNRVGTTTEELSTTAKQTAAQLNQLLTSANSLVVTNRASLVRTLENVSQASDQVSVLLSGLTNTVDQVNSSVGQLSTTAGQINVAGLLENVETLSANAAAASANLRDISQALNSPENVLVLQQTLDSARATFENAQKITADLDDLTGDPAFRNNLKELVNGLGGLVSSTQELQQQVQVAQELEQSLSTAMIDTTKSSSVTQLLTNQPRPSKIEIAETELPVNAEQLIKHVPAASQKLSVDNTAPPALMEEEEKQ